MYAGGVDLAPLNGGRGKSAWFVFQIDGTLNLSDVETVGAEIIAYAMTLSHRHFRATWPSVEVSTPPLR
jgi:hypothetical protein